MIRVRLLPLVAVVAAVTSAGFAPVPPPKVKKPGVAKLDLNALAGTWSVVSYEYRTARGISTSSAYDKIEIKDGQWVQKRTLNGREIRLTPYAIKVDTDRTPHHFDMSLPNSKATTPTRRGLFVVEGDRMTVTYTLGSNPRPASVNGEIAVSQYRWVLRRDAK